MVQVREGGDQFDRRERTPEQGASLPAVPRADPDPSSATSNQERMEGLRLCELMLNNIRRNLEEPDDSGLSLRYNQIKSIQKLIQFLEEGGGETLRGRFKQPTGAGKTVLFGVITKLIDRPTLVLVPRQNLLSSTKDEFVEMVGIPEDSIGLVGAGFREIGKKITIATYQSHLLRMKSDSDYREHVRQCELVVCDEAHRSLGERTSHSIESLDENDEEYENSETEPALDTANQQEEEITVEEEQFEEEVLQDLDSNTNSRSLKLAFTATPKLADKDVADHFPYLIAEEKQGDLVKAKILVPYKIVQVQATLETTDFESYLTQDQEAAVLQRENVYGKLNEEYARVLEQYRRADTKPEYPLRGVAFCVNIDECDKFAREAAKLGLRTRIVTSREAKGRKGNKVIKAAEQALLDQEIDLIITVNKLGEGWNFKPANAAIWARASTSPMVVIQGVGRTCRTYIDEEGREKPYSLVFETQWFHRSRRSGFRKQPDNIVRKKPLTIAQALALNGEDPEAVCSMVNGSRLQVEKYETLNRDGTVVVNGIEYVEPIRYILHNRPYLTNHAAYTLMKFFPNLRSARPACPVVSHGRILTCYLKSEIDKVLNESIYVPSDGIVTLPPRGAEGSESSESNEYVYAPLYLKERVANPDQWVSSAAGRGLHDVKLTDLKVLYRIAGGRQKTREVRLHKRSEIDDLLKDTSIGGTSPTTRLLQPLEELPAGVEIDLGNGATRTAIHLRYSSTVPAKLYNEVVAEIGQRDIKPITEVVIGTNSRPVTLYWKDEIEPIVKRILDGLRKAKQLIQDEKTAAMVARAQAVTQQKEDAKKNTVKEIKPTKQPGLFQVRYKLLVDRGTKTLEGEGLAVDLRLYKPEILRRTLTTEEQRKVTAGLRSLPTMNLYWQTEIDARVMKVSARN